jgi:hypothetical protein
VELTTTTPSPIEQKATPTVHIELAKDDLKELKGLKVGDNVRIVLTGSVKHMDQGENGGGLTVQTKSTRIFSQPESANAFTDLMEDEG